MVDFETRTAQLDDLLGVGRNFDMVSRSLQVGGRKARLWVVNGYAEDMLIERMIGRLLAIGDLKKVPDLASFLAAYVTVPDAAAETDVHSMVVGVFAGKTLLVMDGYDGGVLMDAKEYPTRSVEEPDTSKVSGFLVAGISLPTYNRDRNPLYKEEREMRKEGYYERHLHPYERPQVRGPSRREREDREAAAGRLCRAVGGQPAAMGVLRRDEARDD